VPANVPKSTAVAVVWTTTPGATVAPPFAAGCAGEAPGPPWTAGVGRPGEMAGAEGAAPAGGGAMAPGERAVTVKFWPATTSCVPNVVRMALQNVTQNTYR
jgi:hypothetical protein